MLQCFEFGKRTIRCRNASALQALISYVNLLLHLFPQVKENTKCALSPHKIRNNIYQIGAKHSLEKFQQTPPNVMPNVLSIYRSGCISGFITGFITAVAIFFFITNVAVFRKVPFCISTDRAQYSLLPYLFLLLLSTYLLEVLFSFSPAVSIP